MDATQIRQRRKELGLNQSQLAEKIGVDIRTIVNYEKGGKIPSTKLEILHNVLYGKTDGLRQDIVALTIDEIVREVIREELIPVIEKMNSMDKRFINFYRKEYDLLSTKVIRIGNEFYAGERDNDFEVTM